METYEKNAEALRARVHTNACASALSMNTENQILSLHPSKGGFAGGEIILPALLPLTCWKQKVTRTRGYNDNAFFDQFYKVNINRTLIYIGIIS